MIFTSCALSSGCFRTGAYAFLFTCRNRSIFCLECIVYSLVNGVHVNMIFLYRHIMRLSAMVEKNNTACHEHLFGEYQNTGYKQT